MTIIWTMETNNGAIIHSDDDIYMYVVAFVVHMWMCSYPCT